MCYRESGKDSAKIIARPESDFLQRTNGEANWVISENSRPVFSEDGSKLYFGIAPAPILNDTMLLKEEIVDVEVWNWTDNRLYTQQEVQLDNMKKRSYPIVWHSRKNRFVPLYLKCPNCDFRNNAMRKWRLFLPKSLTDVM